METLILNAEKHSSCGNSHLYTVEIVDNVDNSVSNFLPQPEERTGIRVLCDLCFIMSKSYVNLFVHKKIHMFFQKECD